MKGTLDSLGDNVNQYNYYVKRGSNQACCQKNIKENNRNVHSHSQCNTGNNSEAKYTSEGEWMKLGRHIQWDNIKSQKIEPCHS